MKLEHIKVLDAVVRAGSFARAGNEILQISQPAVSTAIRNLEAELGLELFSRDTYRASLTPQGKAFYKEAKEWLQQADSLKILSQQLASGIEPELRIAFDQGYLLHQVIQVLRKQFKAHPQTRFSISNEILGHSLGLLVDGQIELAIVPWLPGYDALSHLESVTLTTQHFSTMVAPDFEPLNWSGTIYPEDLKDYLQIVNRSDERFLPPGGFGVFPDCRHCLVNDHDTKKSLIKGGLGFGGLIHQEIKQDLTQGLLVPFEKLSTYQIIKSEVRVVQQRNRSKGPVQNSLWQALKQIPSER